jgi:hypothetical protein
MADYWKNAFRRKVSNQHNTDALIYVFDSEVSFKEALKALSLESSIVEQNTTGEPTHNSSRADCTCEKLLAGHNEGCKYHKKAYKLSNVWGISRNDY